MNYHTKDVKEAAFLVMNQIPLYYKHNDGLHTYYVFENKKVCQRIKDMMLETIHQLKEME